MKNEGEGEAKTSLPADDDDVYFYFRWRLKLEGETENMGVCTQERKGVTAAVLMATPCTNSLHFLREMAPPGWGCVVWTVGPVSALRPELSPKSVPPTPSVSHRP